MIISIEGNIGSGKSTQLDYLKNKYIVKHENIETWKAEGWLKVYYENPKYHAFSFQMRVMHDHMDRKFLENKTTIVERSPYSCNYIFGDLLYEDKLLTKREYDLMNKYYESFSWKPDICIYVRTSPQVCFERIKLRNRKSEDLIPLDYLQKLHMKHEQYLNPENINTPVYIIDGDVENDNVKEQINKILLTLKC